MKNTKWAFIFVFLIPKLLFPSSDSSRSSHFVSTFDFGLWNVGFSNLNSDLQKLGQPPLNGPTYILGVKNGIVANEHKQIALTLQFQYLVNYNQVRGKLTAFSGTHSLLGARKGLYQNSGFSITINAGIGAKVYSLELVQRNSSTASNVKNILQNSGNAVTLRYSSSPGPGVKRSFGKIGLTFSHDFIDFDKSSKPEINLSIEVGYMGTLFFEQNWYQGPLALYPNKKVTKLATPSMSALYALPSFRFTF